MMSRLAMLRGKDSTTNKFNMNKLPGPLGPNGSDKLTCEYSAERSSDFAHYIQKQLDTNFIFQTNFLIT